MLKRLTIGHYKSIAEATLQLSSINLLVGPNSAGKSNLIDSIRFLHDAVQYDLDGAISARYGISSVRQWTPQRPYDVKLRVDFEATKTRGSYSVVIGSLVGGGYVVKSEEGCWSGTAMMPVKVGKLKFNFRETKGEVRFLRKRNRNISVTIKNDEKDAEFSTEGKITNDSELFLRDTRFANLASDSPEKFFPIMPVVFEPIRQELLNFEHYSIFPNDLREPQKAVGDKRLTSTGDNLATVWRDLSTPSRRDVKAEILTAMKRVEPNLHNITVKSASGFLVLAFEFSDERGKMYPFNVSQISDGTLRMLGLLTAIYQPNAPLTMSIEEPEQNIHPGALQVLADALKDVGKKRQIFLTTHSPEFMDQFSADNVIVVERRNGKTVCGNMKNYQKRLVREGLFRVGELLKTEGLRVE